MQQAKSKVVFYGVLGATVKNVFPEATYSMTIRDRVVRGKTTSSGSTFTLTLPPVTKAAFGIFTIYMLAQDAAKDIEIEDFKGDAEMSGITLNAADEYTVLMSDG